ncbi:hypothetical protein EUGRSUZ_C00953 [Eucalyptus grandis]|uniref:Uncharacterized protein n=2 Tax=Eucalyptus grandis TaxID=71139 RepID=A0ACC3LBI2_EUCGR|nr:hypothetical protein EUGRSUZ_C00953 [Eucalyptus grandis]
MDADEERGKRGVKASGKGGRNLLLGAGEAFADDLALKGAPFFEGEVLVVLGEAGLALLVHHQYESDPHALSSSFTSFTFNFHREREREREGN